MRICSWNFTHKKRQLQWTIFPVKTFNLFLNHTFLLEDKLFNNALFYIDNVNNIIFLVVKYSPIGNIIGFNVVLIILQN
jgi:hypothetical protein